MDTTYIGRVKVNQAMKGLDVLAPKIIKQATVQVDQIVQRRIQQIINQEGQQVEKIAPKIIKGATYEVYKTSIRLLGRFIGRFTKKELHSIDRKLKRFLKDTA